MSGTLACSDEPADVRFVRLEDLDLFPMHPSMHMRIDHYLELRQEPYIG